LVGRKRLEEVGPGKGRQGIREKEEGLRAGALSTVEGGGRRMTENDGTDGEDGMDGMNQSDEADEREREMREREM